MQSLLSVAMIVVVDTVAVDTDEIHLREDEVVVGVVLSVVGLVGHTILNSVCSLKIFLLDAAGRISKIISVKLEK